MRGRDEGGGGGGDGNGSSRQVIMNENVCGYEITVGQEEEERNNLAHRRRTDGWTDGRTHGQTQRGERRLGEKLYCH